jgi:hypothetical protein
MTQQRQNLRVAIVVFIALAIASVINVWLLVERGPTLLRVIPAAGFVIATIGWLFVVSRARRGDS